MNIHKHKKKLAALLGLGVAAAFSIPLLMPQQPAEDTVRQREYTAARGTITVGVESSGAIEAEPNAHSFEAGAVVGELLVKVGSEVKKGDPLASIAEEPLKEQIEAAKAELADAKASLQEASSTKDVRIAQNDKDKQDGLNGVQQEYDAKTGQLTSEKKRTEDSIKEQENALAQLRQQIEDTTAQVAKLEEAIGSRKEAINQNNQEIGRLKEELLQVTEGSEEQNAIQLNITQLQNENIGLQQQIDAYAADSAFAALEQLKSEQTAAEASLKSNYEELSRKQEEIESTEKQLQQAMENQNEANAFSDYKTGEEVKAMDEAIAKASRNVQTAQEKLEDLQALSQSPTLYAQLDGIVTALNYKVGDTVTDGKPLCVVGDPGEITMTVPVSAADIGSVSVGQKVNIYVDAYAEKKFTGTVKERLLVANDNGDYPVTISVEPDGQLLLPGMKAYATIILKEKADVLTLSNKAISLEDGRQYVLVRDENGELVKKEIVTGFSDGRVSEILDGLTENEVVVVQE